ncbi:MAG: hypothetical protein V2A54_02435 [Bacteroidota bacterium]
MLNPASRAENRLNYYLHGPLARAEIGNMKVQGIDLAYTIQGWIKGTNSVTLDSTRDMGQDNYKTGTLLANANGINGWIPSDVYSYNLNYFNGDYSSIKTSTWQATDFSSPKPLYNGNINSMITSLRYGNQKRPHLQRYEYDQLNRLMKMEVDTCSTILTANSWNNKYTLTGFYNTFSYDADGNLLTLLRKGKQSLPDMDELAYHYYSGTNKLEWVDDAVTSGNYPEDIDDQSSNNYTYDAIGQLIHDEQEEIETVEWNMYGKVSKIVRKVNSVKPQVEYEYNANGDLICGIEKPYNHLNDDIYWTKIFYSLDAMGNVMAEYTRKEYTGGGGEEQDVITLSNFSIYGSSRLGVLTVDKLIDDLKSGMNDTVKRYCGAKMYQMENHLGDVYAVVSDIRVPTGGTASGESMVIKYLKAEVKSLNDYYPYGSLKPSRGLYPDDYEYGMNGQRKLDKAVTGKTGGLYIAKYWIYNSQTGVRWNRDPKPTVGVSDYACFGGNPILFNDILGDKIRGKDAKESKKTKEMVDESLENDKDLCSFFQLDNKGIYFKRVDENKLKSVLESKDSKGNDKYSPQLKAQTLAYAKVINNPIYTIVTTFDPDVMLGNSKAFASSPKTINVTIGLIGFDKDNICPTVGTFVHEVLGEAYGMMKAGKDHGYDAQYLNNLETEITNKYLPAEKTYKVDQVETIKQDKVYSNPVLQAHYLFCIQMENLYNYQVCSPLRTEKHWLTNESKMKAANIPDCLK